MFAQASYLSSLYKFARIWMTLRTARDPDMCRLMYVECFEFWLLIFVETLTANVENIFVGMVLNSSNDSMDIRIRISKF